MCNWERSTRIMGHYLRSSFFEIWRKKIEYQNHLCKYSLIFVRTSARKQYHLSSVKRFRNLVLISIIIPKFHSKTASIRQHGDMHKSQQQIQSNEKHRNTTAVANHHILLHWSNQRKKKSVIISYCWHLKNSIQIIIKEPAGERETET